MASNQETTFIEQLTCSRKKIQESFKRSHEALRVREDTLLSRVDEIEKDYNRKSKEMQQILESLNSVKSLTSDTFNLNCVTDTREGVIKLINSKIDELTADMETSIEFEWDNLFVTDVEQLGTIKLDNPTILSPKRTFLPHVKPVVPNYRTKQLPIAYRCKKSSEQKSPGEFNLPRGIKLHYKTGNIYIADIENHRVQVFSSNGDYLFMFSEKMYRPAGICISLNKVIVTQFGSHCVNMYELEGKLIKSVGSGGNREAQFKHPLGLDVSDRSNNLYVCDQLNNRVQILTEKLHYHSLLGIGLLNSPCDVKVTRDRVLVLDRSDPCMSVFSSDHILLNRLITRGDGKQTNNPLCFDIDREYNIIMSDYSNHCVYVFSQEGEQIHRFGKKGQGIGEFCNPWGIALDNTGHIIVVSEKVNNCLEYF